MTKRDFLLSLSKDELVELIFDFSETNREAGDFIQKKMQNDQFFISKLTNKQMIAELS